MPSTPSSRGTREPKRGAASPARRVAPARHSIALRDGKLRLCVVADTHGRPHPKSGARILAEKPDSILHAGDIGDLSVLDALTRVAPVLAVRGNIDAPVRGIPEALTVDVIDGTRSFLKLLLVHIALYGPKLNKQVAELAREEGASFVICGHSHVPFIGRDKGLSLFNPGSMGPRRFQLPIVFGVMDIDRQRVTLRHVDCETGETWEP